jgi:hypothetical protein
MIIATFRVLLLYGTGHAWKSPQFSCFEATRFPQLTSIRQMWEQGCETFPLPVARPGAHVRECRLRALRASARLSSRQADPERCSAHGGNWIALAAPDLRYRFWANSEQHGCNWMVPANAAGSFCTACRHNRIIPERSALAEDRDVEAASRL